MLFSYLSLVIVVIVVSNNEWGDDDVNENENHGETISRRMYEFSMAVLVF